MRRHSPTSLERTLRYESLEVRSLLAVYTVLNTADAGADSLRWAIEQANVNPGADEIHFDVPGAGPHTIELESPLPTVSEAVTLDGWTQAGGPTPAIQIARGATPLPGAPGLLLHDHSGSTVRGLIISGFDDWGIMVLLGGGHVIEGNFIGTDVTGLAEAGNNGGVGLYNTSNNRIGTDGDGVEDARERNVIAASYSGGQADGAGIGFQSFGVGLPESENNVIAGNYIGTDAAGTAALGNHVGIRNGGVNTLIGTDGLGNVAAERNVISGNRDGGIEGGYGSTIAGNYIGVDVTGQALLANGWVAGRYSIGLNFGASYNVIGTNGDGVGDQYEGNVIAGNLVGGGALQIGNDSAENAVAGNIIGLNATGDAALGVQAIGNALVFLQGAGSGNRIGTDGDGVSDLLERNIISGGGVSVRIEGGTGGNAVAGNYIGTDVTGMIPLYTNSDVIRLSSAGPGNVIGANGDGNGDAAEGNLIAAAMDIFGAGTVNTVVAGNTFGLAADGMTSLSFGHSIFIGDGATSNRIGTNGDGVADATERNVMRYITISDPGTSNNRVAGNYIGVAADGVTSLAVAGDTALVSIRNGATLNRIGTNADGLHDAAEANIISGGLGYAVAISGADGNIVAGNRIGTTADGAAPLPNAAEGVILSDSIGNVIGGTGPGAGNLIAFNGGYGVHVASGIAAILGNRIHSNAALGIDLGDTIVTSNDPGDADAGPNDLQNFPVLASAASTGGGVAVAGALNSTPGGVFRVEFFASAAADPTGHGEGEIYLGFAYVTTDAAGDAAFTVTLPAAVPIGQVITATATNDAGGTSEFSLGVEVVSGNAPPTASATGPATGVPYQPRTFVFSATDDAPDQASGFRYEIDWGDGHATVIPPAAGNGAGVAVDHTYAASSVYQVAVVVFDSHGAASSAAAATINITVAAVTGDDLAIGGTSDHDVIHFATASGGKVKAYVNGAWLGPFTASGRLMAYGGAGNDLLSVGLLTNRDGWLFGGAGDDLLNGGPGEDVLVGGEGYDLAAGGFGRDLIIGGAGADALFGNYDEDVIVAGTTAFDASELALGLIMAEWTSSRSYQQRVANLEGTGSGTSWNDRANGGTFLVAQPGGSHGVTVFDDGDSDLLAGGLDRDWFFANLLGEGDLDFIADLTWRDLAEDLAAVDELDQ